MKKIIDIVLTLVFIFAVGIDVVAIYYNSIEDEVYAQQTIHAGGTISKNENADPDDERFVLEFVYYANKDNSGAEMLEFKLNCFSGINADYIYGYGVQIVNPSQMAIESKPNSSRNYTEHSGLMYMTNHYYFDISVNYCSSIVSYYNTDDFVSYSATTSIADEAHPYIVDIDGKLYSFDFNYDNVQLHSSTFIGASYYHFVSTFDYFLCKSYNAIKNLHNNDDSSTQGVYKNLTFEYADVFNFYAENNGRFDELTDFTYSSNFMDCKVTYVDRGAGVHTDSMFGVIKTEVTNA